MMMTELPTRGTLASRIREVQDELNRAGDKTTAERFEDLASRLEAPDFTLSIAFCGLFSAGKSSLINALCETTELATGAVPTTASVSTMTFHGEHGDILLMDTPGIDSTDESHQAAMEAALHKADLVALVMDYQHVESEDNLEMARMLADQGKQLILVINQIDKHFEWELSFDEFRSRVERTFTDYDIPYQTVFYTTTRASEHNQIGSFRNYLGDLAANAATTVTESIAVNARELVLQHVENVHANALARAEERLLSTVGMVPFDLSEAAEWLQQRMESLRGLDHAIEGVVTEVQDALESLRSDAARTIELAQIAPYETTEKGRLYVESLRPGFRIGWIGSKEKTAKEIHQRLQDFLGDLLDRTEKYLLWPLQSCLREGLKEVAWANARWLDDIEDIGVSFSTSECRALVNEGSLISEQYPYQFVKDVVSSLKRQVLSKLNQRCDAWTKDTRNRLSHAEEEQTVAERKQLATERDAISSWMSHFEQKQDELQAMYAKLTVDSTMEAAQ